MKRILTDLGKFVALATIVTLATFAVMLALWGPQ